MTNTAKVLNPQRLPIFGQLIIFLLTLSLGGFAVSQMSGLPIWASSTGGTLFAILLLFLLRRIRPAYFHLRRSSAVVYGMSRPLPIGRGEIEVVHKINRVVMRAKHGKSYKEVETFSIWYHENEDKEELLTAKDPTEVRHLAEVLSRMGGFTMVWSAFNDPRSEVRTPDELDRSLSQRLEDSKLENPGSPPHEMGVRVDLRPDGVLCFSSPHSFYSIGRRLLAALGAFFCGIPALLFLVGRPSLDQQGSEAILVFIVGGIAAAVGMISASGVHEVFQISKKQIRVKSDVLWLLRRTKTIPIEELESVYVTRAKATGLLRLQRINERPWMLVLAGDTFYYKIPSFESDTGARYLRSIIYRILIETN